MLIKIIIGICLLFTGFVCGGAMATKMYSDRLVYIQEQADTTVDIATHLSEELLACRVALQMGAGL